MSNDVIVSVEQNEIFVSLEEQGGFTLSSTLTNPVTLTNLETLDNVLDVDTTTNGKINGSVLVYKAATNKWTATTTLNAQNVDAGEF